ncbi:MAG TPA: hypothetical protein DCS63_05650 [Elusimicrobia bacterium]|nr:hypothetical protein [Elusimicrobiota bacterium]
MSTTTETELARLAAAELEKCLLRLTGASPGAWQLTGVRVFAGTTRDALRRGEFEAPHGAAIRVKIKGDPSFTTVLLYDPKDTKHISGCFAEEAYYGYLSADQPEVTIIEIGNIVLNALANALLRAFAKTAIPSVPAHFQGDPGAIENWLGAGPGVFVIVSAKFAMQREGRSSAAELLALLPQRLTDEELSAK